MSQSPSSFHSQFEKLFRDYFTPLVWFSMKYVGDLDTAKEVVHSVFVRLWEKGEEIDSSRPIKPYLYTSVYNRSLNYIRDHKKFTGEENLEPLPDNQSSDILEQQEMEERIYAAIEELPDKTKEIFQMSRFENMKYREIASVLNISIKTVESRMSDALKFLRIKLSDYIKILIILMVEIFKSI
ncbi:MAG: RNA polymerase sigma-70 factor [Bacteroidales bacterium]|nr:RNA polymerase sigma-70 factor [Bacteroidales bacterium]MCB9013922.1 RNA polymerase sigma-70 factor [Bacteroidales bacterium]